MSNTIIIKYLIIIKDSKIRQEGKSNKIVQQEQTSEEWNQLITQIVKKINENN